MRREPCMILTQNMIPYSNNIIIIDFMNTVRLGMNNNIIVFMNTVRLDMN